MMRDPAWGRPLRGGAAAIFAGPKAMLKTYTNDPQERLAATLRINEQLADYALEWRLVFFAIPRGEHRARAMSPMLLKPARWFWRDNRIEAAGDRIYDVVTVFPLFESPD